MRIELDCRNMTDKGATHEYLTRKLALPAHYGRNLDALFDVLTDREAETELFLLHWRQLDDLLGSYGVALLETLREASEENPKLEVTLAEDYS